MLFNGRTLIFTFSGTQVRIGEIERLQSLFQMSMGVAYIIIVTGNLLAVTRSGECYGDRWLCSGLEQCIQPGVGDPTDSRHTRQGQGTHTVWGVTGEWGRYPHEGHAYSLGRHG